jgi:hypothetical protein
MAWLRCADAVSSSLDSNIKIWDLEELKLVRSIDVGPGTYEPLRAQMFHERFSSNENSLKISMQEVSILLTLPSRAIL